MADHPDKHIREAVNYALSKGWRLKKGGSRAHAWGRLYVLRRPGKAAKFLCSRRRETRRTMRGGFGSKWIDVNISTNSQRLNSIGGTK